MTSRVAVVGYGYWGPKLISAIKSANPTALRIICERNESLHPAIQESNPGIEIMTDYEEVFRRSDIDAVVLATGPATHFVIAQSALEHGKHVLVEKPLTLHVHEAAQLHTTAQLNRRVLMVDHTYLYTPGIRTLKQQVLDGKLGDILTFESRRLNLGIVQRDTNVIWDLGPHDFSILRYIFDERPSHISATGTRAVSHPTVKTQESTAHVTLFYETFEAHLSLSWVFPLKTRQILVSGSKRTMLYDQCASEPLIALDTRIIAKIDVEKGGPLFEYVSEPAVTILVDDSPGDDLSRMIEDFLSCIQSGETPVAHATQGVEVVAMLRAAEESLARGGEKTAICYVSDGNSDMSQKPEPELNHGR